MLKIKDNIDLKELEKFGFKYNILEQKWHKWLYADENKTEPITQVYVYKRNRHIHHYNVGLYQCYGLIELLLYDLIKADLVEKEEE